MSPAWTNLHMGDQPNNTTLGCAGNKTEQPYDFVTIEPMSPERRERSMLVGTPSGFVLFGGEGDCAQLDDTWLLGADMSGARPWMNAIKASQGESCLHRGDQCTCLCN